MSINLTQKAKEIIALSRQEAIKLQSQAIKPLHVLLGILQYKSCLAYKILLALGIPLEELRQALEKFHLQTEEEVWENSPISGLKITQEVETLLALTQNYAQIFKSETIGTGHILLAALKTVDAHTQYILSQYHVTYENIERMIVQRLGAYYILAQELEETNNEESSADADDHGLEKDETTPQPTNKKTKTPMLDSFSRDLSKLAEEGKLDPIIGRKKEIERVAQILSRRRKNNVLLIGEPGVGKTAIAEGLALQIMQGRIAEALMGKRVISLDVAALVAGTKYRGQFEERIKALMHEITASQQVILFLDEIHTLIGAGSATGSLDAANILKPALARGEIQCVGATTLSEYRQYIEKDGALNRRFQSVIIEPATRRESMEILDQLKTTYEDFHSVTYTPEAIKACVELSDRYISNRLLPDKAIDVLDETGASVHMQHRQLPTKIAKLSTQLEGIKASKNKAVKNQQYEEAAQLRDQWKKLHAKFKAEKDKWEHGLKHIKYPVTFDHVATVIANTTGIPLERIIHKQHAPLRTLKQQLQATIIGQDTAIDKVVKAIQRTHLGLHDTNKPLGTFIFLGPTGVGKTALAKALSLALFNTKEALIRIDMSEYMEKFNVSKLIGAPPGYVGYEAGGQLTEKIRKNPYSIILLDEIEKAHPEIFHVLLQMMDEGMLTDGLGRKIDCKHTIIIMTSNVGARELQHVTIGFHGQDKQPLEKLVKEKVEKALQHTFKPEFINRLDDVILFNSLTPNDIARMVDTHLKLFVHRTADLGYSLIIKPNAKTFLGEKGYDPTYGARPLRRVIQQYLEDPITEQILQGEISMGDNVTITHAKGVEAIFEHFNSLTKQQEDQFAQLGAIYQDWNTKINLISRKDLPNLYLRHVLHALSIAKVIPFMPNAQLLDVGTGGGFPGIPLAILFPQTHFHLVDSIGKKMKAVQAIAQALALSNVSTEILRAETLPTQYDFVLGRAVTNLSTFCEWVKGKISPCSYHTLPNGILYLKGDEPLQIQKPYHIYPLNQYFSDPFFTTKQLVYIPSRNKN
eukprot:gene2958-3691_t